MAIRFNWPVSWDTAITDSIKQQISPRLADVDLGSGAKGPLELIDFQLGDTPPVVALKSVNRLDREGFNFSMKYSYSGNGSLTIRFLVNIASIEDATPGALLPQHDVLYPLVLVLKSFQLAGDVEVDMTCVPTLLPSYDAVAARIRDRLGSSASQQDTPVPIPLPSASPFDISRSARGTQSERMSCTSSASIVPQVTPSRSAKFGFAVALASRRAAVHAAEQVASGTRLPGPSDRCADHSTRRLLPAAKLPPPPRPSSNSSERTPRACTLTITLLGQPLVDFEVDTNFEENIPSTNAAVKSQINRMLRPAIDALLREPIKLNIPVD